MLKRDDLQVLWLEPLCELGPDGSGHLALLASHREPALQKRDVLWVKFRHRHNFVLTWLPSSKDQDYQSCPASCRWPSSKGLQSECFLCTGAWRQENFLAATLVVVCFDQRRCPEQLEHCLRAKTTGVGLCGASREQPN